MIQPGLGILNCEISPPVGAVSVGVRLIRINFFSNKLTVNKYFSSELISISPRPIFPTLSKASTSCVGVVGLLNPLTLFEGIVPRFTPSATRSTNN